MAERGIIFSAPMVRALLDGRKTQTRRLLTRSLPPTDADQVHSWFAPPDVPAKGIDNQWAESGVWAKKSGEHGYNRYCGPLPHRPGDRLYVREAWRTWSDYDHLPPSEMLGGEPVFFEEDRDHCDRHGRLRPGMHMPRWASRLTLTVTDVRVQRLQDISEDDARAEGIQAFHPGNPPSVATFFHHTIPEHRNAGFINARRAFEDLWESLHDKPGTRWEDNPWLYALNFTVEHGNIDRLTHG